MSAILAALAVATSVWGHPCQHRPVVNFAPLPHTRRQTMLGWAEWSTDRHPHAVCQITFTTLQRWTWPLFCTVMVHEVGHLAGLPHSANPRSVMFPRIRRVFSKCRRQK